MVTLLAHVGQFHLWLILRTMPPRSPNLFGELPEGVRGALGGLQL